MKQTVKITFCAIMAALGTAFMLLSYFPYFTYAVPAISGVLTLVVLIEIKGKWPLFTYVVTAVLVFLFAEPEAKFMYILFFGYYPIVKEKFEILSKPIGWTLKLIVFNVSVTIYAIISYFLFFGELEVLLNEFSSLFGGIKIGGILIAIIYNKPVFI